MTQSDPRKPSAYTVHRSPGAPASQIAYTIEEARKELYKMVDFGSEHAYIQYHYA